MELPMCRLCLSTNAGTTALYDEQTMEPNILLVQKVIECTSIKLTIEEDFPSSVCDECVMKLNEWSTFKIQCIVNNDFYRQKQSELRKRLLGDQPATEVVCLDDDDDDVADGERDENPKRKEDTNQGDAAMKKLRIVAQVVIDDDDDEDAGGVGQEMSNGQITSGMVSIDPAPIRYVGNDQDQDLGSMLLSDYELVEGQDVLQFQSHQGYQTEGELDNTAILSSILLDDDDDDDDYFANSGFSLDGLQQIAQQWYHCSVCSRRYSSLAKLRIHAKLHTDNKMKCHICGKMIVMQLLRHMRSQHSGQPFPQPIRCWHTKCANSLEVYYNVDQLLAHMDAKKTSRK
ncbi:uncharacterized protein LOC129762963 [Toxorhynchites rutilus septentrionalis]|uniref:uncharacterized protein LOC129762963 n=1 Tax=Toxorhynchites rutilus septentrionalis TaxID=329112 RepID=UPI00247A3BA8|nr:uncharacterized protein LOC129762963 [Toxorhynchites rutilus septentrionalis]